VGGGGGGAPPEPHPLWFYWSSLTMSSGTMGLPSALRFMCPPGPPRLSQAILQHSSLSQRKVAKRTRVQVAPQISHL